MMLPTPPNQCPYQVSTPIPYGIQEPGQDTTHGHYNKVKGQIKITP